jgi:MoxR-like ATPase
MNMPYLIASIRQQLKSVIVGKEQEIDACIACLLAGGHLLIEDVPGVGKTTLAQALARTFGLAFSRVQFTSDLMPSDLSGVSVFERTSERFVFHRGPLFTQVLLADEINRASPKTQSALLEAMEERQVSVDGETRALPVPFFVIATQNPLDQSGTNPLPESQLDRFLMRVSLGYPDRASERQLLGGADRRGRQSGDKPVDRIDRTRGMVYKNCDGFLHAGRLSRAAFCYCVATHSRWAPTTASPVRHVSELRC